MFKPPLRRRLAPFVLASAVLAPVWTLGLAGPVLAQDAPADPASVTLAKVNGVAVTQADVLALVETLPEAYRSQAAQLMPLLIERAIEMELIGQAATATDLGDDPEVQKRLEQLKVSVVREVYVSRAVDEATTPEALDERYQAFLEANPPADQVHARHILVEQEDEAKDIIAKLADGADFAELARAHSTGPSGPRGGDLGFFGKADMVEPFAEAAFAMEPGQVSEAPVKTQFGWHVIKIEEKRQAPQPSFEEMEQQLRAELARDIYDGLVKDLKEGAEIEAIGPGAAEPAPAGDAGSAQ